MSDYCIENDFAAQKELEAQHEGWRAVSSNALFAKALQQRKDHLSRLISDSVTASGGKISDDLVPHMKAREAIDTLLDYFGANAGGQL